MSDKIKVRIDLGGSEVVEVDRAAWERAVADDNVVQFMDAAVAGMDCDIEFTVPEDQDDPVPFAAHFLPVMPPVPVAAEPVTLDAQVARELAFTDDDPGGLDGWFVVENEQFSSGRWESHHELVIRNDVGEHFRAHYSRGLTEYQDTGPWEGEKSARFDPVERRVRVVQALEWIAAQPVQAGGAT